MSAFRYPTAPGRRYWKQQTQRPQATDTKTVVQAPPAVQPNKEIEVESVLEESATRTPVKEMESKSTAEQQENIESQSTKLELARSAKAPAPRPVQEIEPKPEPRENVRTNQAAPQTVGEAQPALTKSKSPEQVIETEPEIEEPVASEPVVKEVIENDGQAYLPIILVI